MKFTLGWLKEHLETDASLDEICHKLTMLGLEVDGVTDPAAALAPFKVAYVIEAKQHPNADRLRVCRVQTADGEIQVVCGAPNARTGMKAVFAPEGTYIPGTGITLKAAEIRGEASSGMLVSERELELSEDHDGIIDLTDLDPEVGTPFAKVIGLDDPVVEIGLTPNRGDCAGIRGIARDLAAAGLGTLKPEPYSGTVPGTFKSPIGVHLEAGDACPMFVGRYIRGVKNGPSPAWLQQRLKAIGLRPISALVDITNYFTMDRARPLHVFDADKVHGDIHVRFGKPGETLEALDGKEYTADETMCMIADEKLGEAFGGIMGGEPSGCSDETVNVFVESAWFDPVRTAATGRKLGIHSDARYRFERGVDPRSLVPGAEAATQMILELCGGEPSELVVVGEEPEWQRSYHFRPQRVAELTGVEVEREEAEATLKALGFGFEFRNDGIRVSPPSWRPDVHGEADLVEEVIRVHGYDAIPITPLPRLTTLPTPAVTETQARRPRARRALAARGLHEAVTFSFMPKAQAAKFGGGQDLLTVANPISAELDQMRPSILPNLLDAAMRNRNQGQRSAGLFEVGPQYRNPSPTGQDLMASGIRFGQTGPRHWAEAPRAVDAFDAKADALAALEAAGAPVANAQISAEAPAWYHPGQSGSIRLGKNVLATFGTLHPAILRDYDIDGPVAGFECFLGNIPVPRGKGGKSRPLLKVEALLPVERDFAFLVDDSVAADALLRAMKGADKAMITDAAVFDVYTGKGVPEGQKSLAVSVTFQPREATLTDEQIEALGVKIVAAVEKATGGKLRG
jgi:phenylalanyl-tRNA synthetase beta chain